MQIKIKYWGAGSSTQEHKLFCVTYRISLPFPMWSQVTHPGTNRVQRTATTFIGTMRLEHRRKRR